MKSKSSKKANVKTANALTEKTDKLYKAAEVISETLKTLEASQQLQTIPPLPTKDNLNETNDALGVNVSPKNTECHSYPNSIFVNSTGSSLFDTIKEIKQKKTLSSTNAPSKESTKELIKNETTDIPKESHEFITIAEEKLKSIEPIDFVSIEPVHTTIIHNQTFTNDINNDINNAKDTKEEAYASLEMQNSQLHHSMSRLNKEMESILQQNEILRIENKKLIQREKKSLECLTIRSIPDPLKTSKENVSLDNTSIKEFQNELNVSFESCYINHSELHVFAKNINSKIHSILCQTLHYPKDEWMSLLQSLKECLDWSLSNSMKWDSKIAEMARESLGIQQETQLIVSGMEAKYTTLLLQKQDLDEQLNHFKNQQQPESLIPQESIKDSKRIIELTSLLNQRESELDQLQLEYMKSKEWIHHLETQSRTSLCPPLENNKNTKPSILTNELTDILQENKQTIEKLTRLECHLSESKTMNHDLQIENANLKTALESVKDKFKSKESEFKIRFQELQTNTQSIHEHHKELEYILKEYECQFQGILALESTLKNEQEAQGNHVYLNSEDCNHPYPFQTLYSQLQKSFMALAHGKQSIQSQMVELKTRLTTLQQEFHTQAHLLASQSHENKSLVEQIKQITTQLQLKSQHADNLSSDNDKLQHKLKKIVMVYNKL